VNVSPPPAPQHVANRIRQRVIYDILTGVTRDTECVLLQCLRDIKWWSIQCSVLLQSLGSTMLPSATCGAGRPPPFPPMKPSMLQSAMSGAGRLSHYSVDALHVHKSVISVP
jgi:hypothetical protein